MHATTTTIYMCVQSPHLTPISPDSCLKYKWDVAKWRISEPSTPCLGIFWNPDKQCVQEVFSKPLIPVSSGPCRPTTSSLNDLRIFPNDRHAPVFASIPHSNQGYTNNLEYGMERRQLDLADALHGTLAVPVRLHLLRFSSYHQGYSTQSKLHVYIIVQVTCVLTIQHPGDTP